MLNSSLYIEKHPLKAEDIQFRKIYLSALASFIQKYEGAFLPEHQALFDLYQKEFIGSNISLNIKQSDIALVLTYRRKRFMFISSDYYFFFDCFFILALGDKQKGKRVLLLLKKNVNFLHYLNAKALYKKLYDSSSYQLKKVSNELVYSWRQNTLFKEDLYYTIGVVANISSGKSTLINALIGKYIEKSQQMACTAKIHAIYNKPFEDGYITKSDGFLKLGINKEELLVDNPHNVDNKIEVYTYFHLFRQRKIVLVDTPGINSSLHKEHEILTKSFVESEEYDKILYVCNICALGTIEEQKYLQYIQRTVKNEQVIFVLNKLDDCNEEEDSISDSINNLRKELKIYGFKNPVVYPVSASVAYLSKKSMFNIELTTNESKKLATYESFFNGPYYDLSQYYNFPEKEEVRQSLISKFKGKEKYVDLFCHSGFPYFEFLI